jgi:hypothetical protein
MQRHGQDSYCCVCVWRLSQQACASCGQHRRSLAVTGSVSRAATSAPTTTSATRWLSIISANDTHAVFRFHQSSRQGSLSAQLLPPCVDLG